MLPKNSKIRVLENFQALDYTLFGKPLSEVKVCCPFLKEEYLTTKGALLSVVIEMYEIIGHSPSIKEKINQKKLNEMAINSAKVARENSKVLVASKAGRNSIKKIITESLKNDAKQDLNKLVQTEIRKKAFSLAIDNLLLGKVVKESKDFKALSSWKGKVLEEAYTKIRDSLVESVMTVLEA